jgi:hypothetical protein
MGGSGNLTFQLPAAAAKVSCYTPGSGDEEEEEEFEVGFFFKLQTRLARPCR